MKHFIMAATLAVFAYTAAADQVVDDNQIVNGSQCVGIDCADGEDFGPDPDTLVIKSLAPTIKFNDTSFTSFPQTDWQIGISDDAMTVPASFFIRNSTSDSVVLILSPDGDAALGANAEVVEGAISVGSTGNERRITFVADAVDDTDAVTLGQFNTYKTTAMATVDNEISDINTALTALEDRVDALVTRIDAANAAVTALQSE